MSGSLEARRRDLERHHEIARLRAELELFFYRESEWPAFVRESCREGRRVAA